MPSLPRLVCITLLAGSAYAATLGHGFVWDDRLLVVESRTIQRWTNLPRALVDDFFGDAAEGRGYHRPLVTLSYMLDHALWGLRAPGYHLTNVLLHVASTLLVYLVAPALGAGGSGAFLASAVFGLHPIHTESVAWIAGRTDVIATALLLLSLLLYARAPGRRSRGALLAFALALLAKEIALVFPALLLLYESLFDPPAWRERLRRAARAMRRWRQRLEC